MTPMRDAQVVPRQRRSITALVGILLIIGISACGASGGERAVATTTSAPTGTRETTTEVPFAAGKRYHSEDGWSLQTGDHWAVAPGPIKGISSWYTSAATHDFRPNVNVIVQPSQGMDPEQYLDLSKRSLSGLTKAKLLGSKVITTSDGAKLAVMQYQAEMGLLVLRFYATAIRDGNDMVLATYTARAGDYEDVVGDTEKLLRTLRVD